MRGRSVNIFQCWITFSSYVILLCKSRIILFLRELLPSYLLMFLRNTYIKWYMLNMAYLNSFKIKTKQKNCPDLANIEFKIASHPSTYPVNALLTPRFLLHWTAPHLNMCASEEWSDKTRLESHIHCSRYFSAKFVLT